MRSVFDQYKQPENQLTHALACALDEDRGLLARFIKEIAGVVPPNIKSLKILEQQMPGEDSSYSVEEAEERPGLPDACIHDDEAWALLIESKVQAALTKDQLLRHHQRAQQRCKFTDITILVIGIEQPQFDLPYIKFQAWTEIYKWLKKQEGPGWAKRAAQYMEIWEGKMIGTEYLTYGTVTGFYGIPFGDGEPYNYINAKRLLKLAMDDLQNRKDLELHLGMNPKGARRGAITGKSGKSVWDFLPFKGLTDGKKFTKFPHLTLALEHDRLVVIMIVPSSIKPVFRRNILQLGFAGFSDLMSKVNQNLNEALEGATGAAPWVIVLQRRYPSQRSAAITDAMLQYDLRTAFPGSANKQVVKAQSQWLTATYAALEYKKSNLQFAVGAIFPYKNCEAQRSDEILDYIAKTWIACKPLLEVMIKDRLTKLE